MLRPQPEISWLERECARDLGEVEKKLRALENFRGKATVENVLEPLNLLWMGLDWGLNRSALYGAVHPESEIRIAADDCERHFTKLATAVRLSRPIFELVTSIEISPLEPTDQRYIQRLLQDFRRAGVNLKDETQEQVRRLREEVVRLGQAFGKNIREDVREITLGSTEELMGLPVDYIEGHRPNGLGNITIKTDYPDFIPFMTYAHSDQARLKLYRANRQRGYPANIEVLKSLLSKRHRLATLLGYPNWAAYATEDKMIRSGEAVKRFIDRVDEASSSRSDFDYAQLLNELRRYEPQAIEVGDWQKLFLEQNVKRKLYQVDGRKVREYLTYSKTRDGLFRLTEKMFGVTYRRVDEPAWHEDVEIFELLDGERVLGRFYLDMFPRAQKYKHAAAFPLVTGVAGVQIPEAALVCNFPSGGPMEHRQVTTFFHEFGHLLHHLFGGEQRWLGLSGFNTEWDFVEVPSQLFEEWAWDLESLQTFATNSSGEPIPAELVAAMQRARDFGKGIQIKHQMFYAAVSLALHAQDPATFDIAERMKNLQAQYSPFAYVDDTFFHLSFGHLDGYSAVYYTYMWSLVIAKDLFSIFQSDGLLNESTAQRYRRTILNPGGSEDAVDMVREFLKRDYSFDTFSKWLNKAP